MRAKIIIIAISLLTLVSCADPGGDPIYEGFTMSFSNYTNRAYNNSTLYIGAYNNNVFTATDSIQIPQIKLNGNGYLFLGENRWKPNLNKIKDLHSEKCYFMLKLTNNRKEIVKRYQQANLFSLSLPKEINFKGDYGRLLFSIFDNEVTAYAVEEVDLKKTTTLTKFW